MQPSTPTKPVMDVAPPKSLAPTPNPFVQNAAAPKPTAAELPVRPAPLSAGTPQPAAPPAAQPVDTSKQRKAAAKKDATQSESHAPVALITVTVFVMLVLSALAVIVYITS